MYEYDFGGGSYFIQTHKGIKDLHTFSQKILVYHSFCIHKVSGKTPKYGQNLFLLKHFQNVGIFCV